MKIPKEEDFALAPGIYLAEITHAKEERSKTAGTLMWSVVWKAVDFNTKLCHDRMMMEGGGAKITAARLSVLLPGRDEADVGDLIGLRAWLAVVQTEYQGAKKLEVDINAKGSRCGYFAEEPAGVKKPDPAADATPF